MYRIYKVFTKNLIELLFSILGTEIIYSSMYRGLNPVYFFLIIIINIIGFAFYDFVNEKNENGPRIYIPVFLIVSLVLIGLIKFQEMQGDIAYSTWIFNGGHLLQECLLYEIVTMIFTCFIFSSMYFYFTVKIYRRTILLLLVFIDIIIHMKCLYNEYSFLVYSFIILYVCIMFKASVNSQCYNSQKSDINSSHFNLSFILFISLVSALALFMPKPKSFPDIPALNSLKQYFNTEIKSIEGEGFNVEISQNRKVNQSTKENSDTVIFKITGSNPKYLINHNYDLYKNNEWYLDNKELYLGQNISKNSKSMLIDFTINNIDKSSLSDIKNAQNDYEFNQIVNLQLNNFATCQLSHPPNTTKCQIENSSEDLFTNGYDMILNRKVTYFQVNNQYKIFYNQEPEKGTKQDLIMRYFNRERYEDFLKEVCSDKKQKEQIDMMNDETSLYLQINNNISEDVENLSKEITKNSISNYDKAKSIEEYLKNGDYVYDLSINEDSKDNEYINDFILESKKGYCVQFATAMTIMCREAGIPARYVEGYLVDQDELNKDTYEVKESSAHAFVQVYIPGYGWEIFDPTPSLDDEDSILEVEDIQIKTALFIKYKGYFLALLFGIIIMCILLFTTRRYRRERNILKKPNDVALEIIIKDSIKLLRSIGIIPKENETEMIFAQRIYKLYNIKLIDIVKIYYDNKYAQIDVTKENVIKAIYENRKINKFVKQYKKQG